MAELGCVQQRRETGLFGCADALTQSAETVVAAPFVIESGVGTFVGLLDEPLVIMRLIDPYSVPGPIFTDPPDSSVMSRMIAYP